MEQELTNNGALAAFLATSVGIFVFSIVMVWSAIWKAIALWKAARRGETAWYVIMLLLNTLGILEIIYIFAIAKNPKESK
jgi:formate-dependent nitrite reductase membrane component NrfD